MAMTYLTKLKPEPMGAHSLSTAYGVNSLVMSGDGAAAYISVKDVPAGTPLTNTEYWKIHTDLTAVKQSAEAAAQKANAARNEMLEIARNLTDMVEKSGNSVQAELVGGLPFDRVETMLAPIQSGSGDPSPNNIRTISGWTGAKLTRCGKNLIGGFAGKTQNGLTFTINADGSVSVNGTSTAQTELSAPIYLPAGNYYLSGCPAGGTSSNVSGGYAQYCYINGSAYKFDAGSGIHLNIAYAQEIYVNIVIRGGTTINKTFYPQIETGYVKTDYEPYTGDTYSADFGQTVYGGTLDWNTGVMTVDRVIKDLTGTESIVINNSQYFKAPRFEIEMVVPGIITTQAENLNMICSHYKVAANPVNANDVNHSICGWMGGGKVYLRDDAYSTVDEYKAYLAAQYSAGTPVQIAYKLATPTTIQLTPQEIKQLQGVNTLYGDGSISMTGRADKALALEARIAALEAAG